MRFVADTNIILSSLYWGGIPRKVIDLAKVGSIQLCTSQALLTELSGVIRRRKFGARMNELGLSADQILQEFLKVALVIETESVEPVVKADPDDDAVIACAVYGECQYIVSGDAHLLSLVSYKGIAIVTAAQMLDILAH